MINLRSFEVPTVVKHALGAISCLADEVKALGMQRPMVVTDSGLVKIGLADEVVKILKAANLDFYLFDEVIPNPPIALVDRGAEIYKSERCDGLLGLGGGSSIDTAKSIGVVAAHGGSIRAFEWASPNPITKRIPPLIAVPTRLMFLPSSFIVLSHTASVLLTVPATVFSRSEGPDCASCNWWITFTRRSYNWNTFSRSWYFAFTTASLAFSAFAASRSV